MFDLLNVIENVAITPNGIFEIQIQQNNVFPNPLQWLFLREKHNYKIEIVNYKGFKIWKDNGKCNFLNAFFVRRFLKRYIKFKKIKW